MTARWTERSRICGTVPPCRRRMLRLIPLAFLVKGLAWLLVFPVLVAFFSRAGLELAAWFVPSFHVTGFWGALVGAVAISIVGWGVHIFTGEKIS